MMISSYIHHGCESSHNQNTKIHIYTSQVSNSNCQNEIGWNQIIFSSIILLRETVFRKCEFSRMANSNKGTSVDEDGNTDQIENLWSAIIETTSGSIHGSMESRINQRTGERGFLVLHFPSHTGPFWSVVHRETYKWQNRAQKFERPLCLSFRGAGTSSRCLQLPNEQKKDAVTIFKSFPPSLPSINSDAKIEKPC